MVETHDIPINVIQQLLRAIKREADGTKEAEEFLDGRKFPPDDAFCEPRHEKHDAEREQYVWKRRVGDGKKKLHLHDVGQIREEYADQQHDTCCEREPARQDVVSVLHLLPAIYADEEDRDAVGEAVEVLTQRVFEQDGKRKPNRKYDEQEE